MQRVHKSRWAGVYQRLREDGEPVYFITYKDHDGKKRWEKVGARAEGYSPEVAADIRGERIRTARHGGKVKTAREIRKDQLVHNRPLGQIAAAYFEAKGDGLRGVKTDRNRWEKHLDPIFAERRVSSLTELDVQRLKTDMAGKAPATVWNGLEMLRRLCNWGARHGMAPALSFTIKMPKRDNERVEYLTPEEAERLEAVLDSWPSQDVARMLRVAMLTGMRRGEIFKLEDNDLDFQHGLISIRSPKGGKSARVPMSAPVAEILREQLAGRETHCPDSNFVFPGQGGAQRVECTAVRRIKAKACLPKSFRIFHGMRHHLAVTLANSGRVTLDMIGELLTHKSHAMTRRYAAFLPETTKAAADLAAELIQPEKRDNGKLLKLKGEK
jgi:integrase